jgi:hypothetical protein
LIKSLTPLILPFHYFEIVKKSKYKMQRLSYLKPQSSHPLSPSSHLGTAVYIEGNAFSHLLNPKLRGTPGKRSGGDYI